jgi:hypothetical protein
MKRLFALLGLLLLSTIAKGQVIAVHFAEEKHVDKYKKHVTYVNGEPVLVGEPKKGINLDLSKGTLTFDQEGDNEIFVADPSDPTQVPYKYDREGNKVERSKKYVVSISGRKIRGLSILIRDNNLRGLANEYNFRLDYLGELMDEAKELEKGSDGWFLAQARILTQMEKLYDWLQNTAYPKAAEKFERDLEKQRKEVAKSGARARYEKAIESIRSAPTPQSLIEASKELTGGKIRFSVMESQHLRVVYMDSHSQATIEDLLRLGERVLEGWRNEFVDPYLSETSTDRIPSGIFQEWFFGPSDIELYEKFFNRYYGLQWGPNKERSLQLSGTINWGYRGLTCLNYWKTGTGQDLEGIITNNLGRTLAAAHYNNGSGRGLPDWLAEAAGYYCSIEYLGRNTVVAVEFRDPKYLKPDPGEEGEKSVKESLRDWLNEIALNEGPRLVDLAIMSLFEMEDKDIAKSWSVFDFIARKEGKQGQDFLRAQCESGSVQDGMMNKWRAAAETIYEVTGVDVFKLFEDRWRDYAATGQKDERRRR